MKAVLPLHLTEHWRLCPKVVWRQQQQKKKVAGIINLEVKVKFLNSKTLQQKHCNTATSGSQIWLSIGQFARTVVNCRQHDDNIIRLAAQLPCRWQLTTVTTPSLSRHHAVTVQLSDWWNKSFAVYFLLSILQVHIPKHK